jgi:N-acetylglucosaminyldiphosphoundecaprenol N-acetyl-beta-D-mannosaminyltransferase
MREESAISSITHSLHTYPAWSRRFLLQGNCALDESPADHSLVHWTAPHTLWRRLFRNPFRDAVETVAGHLSQPGNALVSVAFLNMHNYNVACALAPEQNFLSEIDYIFGDGIALQVARRIFRLPDFFRISGTELVPALLRNPVCRGLRIFLLGGEKKFIEETAWQYSRLFPERILAGYHHGFFSLGESQKVVEYINSCAPDLLLVGMGTPIQEFWLQRHQHQLRTRVAICVGGLFHYWHGSLRRAPVFVQLMGLEWLWILTQQPHKCRRYLYGALTFFTHLARTEYSSQR